MTIPCMQAWREFLQPLRHDVHTAEINRQNTSRMGTFQIPGGVADHPYRMVRGNSSAVEGKVDRVGRRLVARGILGADGPDDPPVPAEMLQLGAQVLADLVADHGDVAADRRRALQQTVCTGQRLEAREMDAMEGLVEHL